MVSRGKPGTLPGKAANGSMWAHMKAKHKVELEEVRQQELARKEVARQPDKKDETVLVCLSVCVCLSVQPAPCLTLASRTGSQGRLQRL